MPKENNMTLILQITLIHCDQVSTRGAQCIDKEILIIKIGNIDIDIDIDKRTFG